jgi:hypothetical protein
MVQATVFSSLVAVAWRGDMSTYNSVIYPLLGMGVLFVLVSHLDAVIAAYMLLNV